MVTVGDVLNPYWAIVCGIPNDPYLTDGHSRAPAWLPYATLAAGEPLDVTVTRDYLTQVFACAICSPGTLAWLVDALDGTPVVEMGAGTGYWAWLLTQAGVDVVAYDREPRDGPHRVDLSPDLSRGYVPVRRGGPRDVAGHADRALLLVWPPHRAPMAAGALDAFAGDLLVHVGEFYGATGNARFFKMLERDFELVSSCPDFVSWAGMRDGASLWRRRRPGAVTVSPAGP